MRRAGEVALRLVLGPLWYLRVRPLTSLSLLLLVMLLTLLTQTGGVILWLALPALAWLHRTLRPRGAALAVPALLLAFAAIYLAVNLTVVPWAAARGGRVPLPCFAAADALLRAHNPIFCLANRHYTRPAVRDHLVELARNLKAEVPGTILRTLDAGFPFLDGFPLLPHLSHRRGRDVDLALFWKDAASGRPVPPPSPIGYWVYAGPAPGEVRPCRDAAFWLRWDFPWLQRLFPDTAFDLATTRVVLGRLHKGAARAGIDRILLEPHLRDRMGLSAGLIRFQGCAAARHDDHIHIRFR